jgi:hypothetical protein
MVNSETPSFSHAGLSLTRAVAFRFALDLNAEQRILFAKCAGARRFTINHHLARVRDDLDVCSPGWDATSGRGIAAKRFHHSLPWTGFSFINEFNAWKWATTIVIEDLDIAGMTRNRNLAKAVSDAGMGELSRQILYKAKWHHVDVLVAHRHFPSSKMCSGCGRVKGDFTLAERVYRCGACGLNIDRDLNAAINVARWRPGRPLTKSQMELKDAVILST